MPYNLFDALDANGTNQFKVWTESLQKTERAKLDVRLDMLEQNGMGLLPQLLAGTDRAGLMKLKVHGKVQLRPILCRGPVHMDAEFTLLAGATERDWQLEPKDVLDVADGRKSAVITNPTKRRKKHECVS